MPTPLESMRIVARHLSPLEIPFSFVGGAVMCVLVDHPELTEFRPTKDVDVVVEVATYAQFSALETRLRAAEFEHDTSSSAPICRWVVEGCRVDVMPMDSRALGMNSKWFPEVLRLSKRTALGEGINANVVSPAMFLAMKLEAFKDRGKGDFYMSHDLEDIITLVDGRSEIVADVAAAPDETRAFIAGWFAEQLEKPDFMEAIPGHLPAMMGSRQRLPIVINRLKVIASNR